MDRSLTTAELKLPACAIKIPDMDFFLSLISFWEILRHKVFVNIDLDNDLEITGKWVFSPFAWKFHAMDQNSREIILAPIFLCNSFISTCIYKYKSGVSFTQ
jgi:hypothetical protein